MRGKLNDEQIEHILYSEVLGRIGCCDNGKVYVVPVTYVYSNGYIFAHSQVGMKIEIMRKNPAVCFQVDVVENMATWRSVIAWGQYEELTNDEQQTEALRILSNRLEPIISSESLEPLHESHHPPEIVSKPMKAVVYRIRLLEKTGRFEKMSLRPSADAG